MLWLGLIGATGFLFVVDRQVLATLKVTLAGRFALTNADYSLLLGAFMLAYTSSYLWSGRLVDQWGTRKTFWLFAGGMSLAVIGAGLARTFAELLAAQFFLGIAQSGIMPAVLASVTNWFPAERRATAFTLQGAIQNCGAIGAAPVIAALAATLGWRWAFVVPGLAGFALAAALVTVDRPALVRACDLAQGGVWGRWRPLLQSPQLRAVLLARMCSDPFWFFLLYWQPAFLQERLGLTLPQLGRVGWIPALFSVATSVALGLACDRLIRRGWGLVDARLRLLGMITFVAPVALLLPWMHRAAPTLGAMALLYAMCSGWLLLSNLLVADVAPAGSVATAFGLVAACGGAMGILFNFAAGFLSDVFGVAALLGAGFVLHPIAWLLIRRVGKKPADRFSAAKQFSPALVGVGVILTFAPLTPAIGAEPESGANAKEAPAESTLEWRDGQLTIGNRFIERRWKLSNGLPAAQSLRADGVEWLKPASVPTTTLPGAAKLAPPYHIEWAVEEGAEKSVEASSRRGTLTVLGADGRGYRWHLKIFPDNASISSRFELLGDLGGAESAAAAEQDLLEDLKLARDNLQLGVVELFDQTDHADNLVHERTWRLAPNESVQAATCLASVEDPLTGAGLILLKHAPLPSVRPVLTEHDVVARGSHVAFYGHGLGTERDGYAWSTIGYSGGHWGRARALHELQARLRVFRAGRDGLMISNTWGDRNRDARIGESFVLAEIEAGRRLGVDVCQIDDGWQEGITRNSAVSKNGVWEGGFWASNPQFWQPRASRFPRGLSPMVAAVQSGGMGLGLWFSPDAAGDYVNWAKDAATVVDLFTRWNVRQVKIDGTKLSSKPAEANFHRFVDRVLQETKGELAIDLDITAGNRAGYFGLMETSLFLENRYSDFGTWWPHATLRNLWQLSWYVEPQRLRIEFLNSARNAERYAGSPLAPVQYPADYACAMTLVANPLAWFEVSNLPPSVAEPVRQLIAVWKRNRAELQSGIILPIGDSPSGAAWTGFCSVSADSCQVMIFRERTENAATSIKLPIGAGRWEIERLAGEGEATCADRALRVSIPAPLHYLWLRLTPAGDARGTRRTIEPNPRQ